GNQTGCPACPGGQLCLTSHQCCQPTTCAALGRTCGTSSDNCGNTLFCGSCGANQLCGSAGACVCSSGFATCNATVCGTNTASDVHNCGACGNQCPVPTGGSAACRSGVCAVVCPNGTRDCGDGTCRSLCP